MDDIYFHGIAIISFLLVILIGLYHRIKAHTPEKISRAQEGKLIWLRLFALPILIVFILHLSHPEQMRRATVSLPGWLRWTGAVMAIVGVPLIYWVFHSLGKNITDTVVTRSDHTLVTAGPYRWVRHPFYSAFAVLWTGFALLLSSWLFVVLSIPVVVYLVIRTPVEEANLVERFGDGYRAYMARTGRYWPRLR